MARQLALLVLLGALVVVPFAHADADPASDFLISQQTFVPPDDNIPRASAAQLNATVAKAKASGYPIKVALIGSRYDMGSVTILYKRPTQYARFLGTELNPFYKGKLLVVMPNGLAASQRGKLLAHENSLIAGIAAPGTNGAAVAAAGTAAVAKLAGIAPAPLGSSTSSGTGWLAWVAIGAGLAVLVAVGGLMLRRRRKLPGLDSNQQPFG